MARYVITSLPPEHLQNILSRIEHRFTSFRDTRFKVYSKIRPPLYSENSIKNISGESDFYNIAFGSVKNFELPYYITSELNNYTFASYYKASEYVPIENVVSTTLIKDQDKPILYDSKGKPIKTKKSKSWLNF